MPKPVHCFAGVREPRVGGGTSSPWPPGQGPCGCWSTAQLLGAQSRDQPLGWRIMRRAELVGLCIPPHDVGLDEDGDCPWPGGGLKEEGLSHRESLQAGLEDVGGSFLRTLVEGSETC